ncbi:MAG: RNB domain-containing ribonuclease [Ignavibacteriaceae bacterium]
MDVNIFSKDVLDEASSLKILKKNLKGRKLIEGITIDGPDSLDLDDAIQLDYTGDGYVLHVSIADVSAFIRPGSGLFNEAIKRTMTRYLSDGNIPMLPEIISEGKLSLLENEVRPALTFSITLTPDLELDQLTIKETIFKNRRRLNYTQVDYIIDSCPDDPDYRMLNDCYILARRLMDKRRQSGALVIFDLQRLLFTNEDGQLMQMKSEDAHKSNIIIQEFMILTNAAVAEFAALREYNFLYRNHTARQVIPQRAEVLEQLQTAVSNPKLLDAVVSRSNLWFNKAEYGVSIKGHYSLNLPAYTHVTSPLRRAADLLNHELLKAQFNKKESTFTIDELNTISSEINSVIIQNSEQKKKFFKEESIRDTNEKINLYNAERLIRLPGEEFKPLLKEACQSGFMNEEFERALTKRIESNNLGVDHLAIILFDAEDYSEAWKNIRAKALELTLNSVGYSDQVLHLEEQAKRITDYDVDYYPYQNIFAARAVAKVDGKLCSVPEYQLGYNKRKARRAASCAFLKCYILNKLVPADETKKLPLNLKIAYDSPEFNDGDEAVMENYIGKLTDICISRRIQSEPVFEFFTSGPHHNPIHNCNCKLIVGENEIQTSATAKNRKLTKQLAAKKMYEEILSLARNKPVKKSGPESKKQKAEEAKVIIADNYVGILIESCVKSGLPMPEFDFVSEGPIHKPKFICKVSVKSFHGTITASGSSYNKKFAKQFAARDMVLNKLK